MDRRGDRRSERGREGEDLTSNSLKGMAIAFCSAAQVILLPLFGWWSDKRNNEGI